jgi:Protein of unknown function (DUF3073)
MGRGRAKAKQTKVARELKYRNHSTDLDQLQRELSGDRGPSLESSDVSPAGASELDDDADYPATYRD